MGRLRLESSMLQHLRDNSRGIISFILIGALVVIFALAGVERLFNWDPSADRVAKVNGESISKIELNRAIARQKQDMMNRYGDQVPAEFLTDEYLSKPVLQNLIRREVLAQTARNGGMAVGPAAISEQISTSFKNKDGTFDADMYKQALARMGYTHSTFVQQLQKDMVLNQLHMGVSASAFTTVDEFNDLVALSYQTRDFSYFIVPADKVKASVQITDAEISDEYAKNPATYTSEDEVAVDYIDLSVADLMKGVSVSEEQIRKQYEQNLSSFVAAPEREAAHILIEDNDPEKIKKVSEKLAAGADFAAVAKEFSDDQGSKDQGGNLGFTKGDTFPAEFEKALAGLKVGEISSPVKSDAGTHFIKLISARGTTAPSFDEQKVAIEDQLKRAEAENIFVAKMDELKDKSFTADNLGEVAKELGLEVHNTGLFSRANGKGVASNKLFVDAAFSDEVLKEGNSSDPVEFDSSRVLVLKKTDYQPAHLRPLEEVKAQIVASLTEQKARQSIRELGQSLVAQLRDGSSLADIAKAQGEELHVAAGAKRNGGNFDAEVQHFAFAMTKPAAQPSVDGFVTNKGDFAVVALSSVNPGSEKDIGAADQKSAMIAQVSNIFGEGEYSSYEQMLKEQAEIK